MHGIENKNHHFLRIGRPFQAVSSSLLSGVGILADPGGGDITRASIEASGNDRGSHCLGFIEVLSNLVTGYYSIYILGSSVTALYCGMF
jgi:hypothetical protein